MLFNSFSFLIFFPIVVCITFIIPKKYQYIWLLVASYYFYMNWDAHYALLLLFSTFVTYISGVCIDGIRRRKNIVWQKKIIVACCFIVNLCILFFFKYFNFAVDSLNTVLSVINIKLQTPQFSVILPVGISFYIFQALSYTMDVYRGDVEAEHNFLKYALFVSFFPQLVAGPIERSKNLLKQINEIHKFSFEKMRDGLLLMLWGYFLKIVIADRVALFVDTVYGDVYQYGGLYAFLATGLFAIQIYCDFAGYSTIAVGAAEILGFRLMENFDCPYFATNIKDFWRRWHISLSSWFRDYLYIPLGGNRKGTLRKYINIIIVFSASGLWHGAAITFVIWGLLHGIYQVIGDIIKPLKGKIQVYPWISKILSIVITFGLVDFAWIFFRANSFTDAKQVIGSILRFENMDCISNGSVFALGLNTVNTKLLIFSVLILFIADWCKYKGVVIRQVIIKQILPIRWMCYLIAVFFVLIFGIWGASYDAASFIYFQF